MRLEEGFPGQRMVVLPEKIIKNISVDPLTAGLYLTDIGYYPRARFHYRERPVGSQEFILIYCIKGNGIIETSTRKHLVRPNSFCIIPPSLPHKYHTFSDDPWSIYWLHFNGLQVRSLFDRYSPTGELVLKETMMLENRIKHFNSILNILESGFAEHHLEYVNLNLVYLVSSFVFQDLYSGKGYEQHSIVSNAINVMRNKVNKQLTIDSIANEVLCSSSHFYAIFKNQTGYSPLQYFNQLKIQKSCHLLSFTDLTIKEISSESGIDDPFYFSRLFKKVMGISPFQYRLKYKV